MNGKAIFFYVSQLASSSAVLEFVDKLPVKDATKHLIFAALSLVQSLIGIFAYHATPGSGDGGKLLPPTGLLMLFTLWFGVLSGGIAYEATHPAQVADFHKAVIRVSDGHYTQIWTADPHPIERLQLCGAPAMEDRIIAVANEMVDERPLIKEIH